MDAEANMDAEVNVSGDAGGMHKMPSHLCTSRVQSVDCHRTEVDLRKPANVATSRPPHDVSAPLEAAHGKYK